MGKLSLNKEKIESTNSGLAISLSNISRTKLELNSLSNRIDRKIISRNGIHYSLNRVSDDLIEVKDDLQKIEHFVNNSANKYFEMDDYLVNLALALGNKSGDTYFSRLKLDPYQLLNTRDTIIDLIKEIASSETLLMLDQNLKFKVINRDGKSFITLRGAQMTVPSDYINYRNLLVQHLGGNYGTFKKGFVNRMINGGGIPLHMGEYGINNSDLSKFSNLKSVQQYIEVLDNKVKVFNVAGSSFVNELKVWDDFNWSNTSTLTKTGKFLGGAGTLLTGFENLHETFYDPKTGSYNYQGMNQVVDFAVNVGVDIGMGAGATASGAAVGSLIVPPIGTVVGAGVGVAINFGINYKFGEPPQSIVDHTKDLASKVVDEAIDVVGEAFDGAVKLIDGVGDKLDNLFW
ncbi:hypothetical protein [Cytobacillus sp. IB215316]|uniref:hypothetical protein n=1 Tax=Cytobacillus sp. IB215316 TaxID=3097354 RepID=UPI002A13F5FE|nr:hypothetical protein [Cytobacillus sp. IB215316]MDX8360751.1 hypothetical protein [Cytobacillus sp. IB215316]